MTELDLLPGGRMMRKGLADAAWHEKTVESLLVSIALGWLQEHGLAARQRAVSAEPEIELYSMLRRDPAIVNPYSRYNSLIRQLVSFQRAFAAVWRADTN